MPSLSGHELVGQRLVGKMPSQAMVNLWLKTTSRIVKYGFAIEYRDLEPPRTGIFDGLRIVLDPDVDFEMQCFILLHLFGHSVQWVALSLVHKLEVLQHAPEKNAFMKVLQAYEFEAVRYGRQLMHEAGVDDLGQWYSDFVGTDWTYVERYYQTDSLPPWHECVVEGQPLIEPLAIPPLAHREVEVRFAF